MCVCVCVVGDVQRGNLGCILIMSDWEVGDLLIRKTAPRVKKQSSVMFIKEFTIGTIQS